MPSPRLVILAALCPLLLSAPQEARAQRAHVSEEVRTLETYPFSEPNPVPILSRDARLYPYHSFEGYSTTSEPRDWKVIHLENDLIEVFVLPEVGGKVWGAVVKETGHEFIYRNEVLKFRNIALRGPWTSGGIEFNFGVIGHTPATATPVDYTTRENDDGSASVFVGGMDLPSRTHWRVEIRLPADRAYFETRVLWYNPTPLEQPYYNWMTGAAFARDDLVMSMPGNQYLEHSGNPKRWPFDDRDRYLPAYRNNTFEGHKSYHVVGELNDFFGGYYTDDDYGFGHWARHEDMPGQKLWLWALSREGGVWEELLTDTDGQYVEFQAGRLFVQYSPGADVNPIRQAGFDPMSASRWSETWFPVEGIGGLTDVSKEGAMHVTLEGDQLTIDVNAFGTVSDTLEVWSAGQRVERRGLRLPALEPVHAVVTVAADQTYRVRLAGIGLDYTSDPASRLLARPFATDSAAMPEIPRIDRMVAQARELLKGRQFVEASALFEAALEAEPWNRDARVGRADLAYRSGFLQPALDHVNRALQLDAYDAEANFLAGVIYRALGRGADARDAFGWAARSTGFRSAAYAQLAELAIIASDDPEAERYARLAIDFDRHSVPGWQALALVGRRRADAALAEEALSELEALDPLHHFVAAERFLSDPSPETSSRMMERLGGEFPEQTVRELAIGYANRGLSMNALQLLRMDRGLAASPIDAAWVAYLERDRALLPASPDIDFEFPFRRETLAVLEWADRNSADWAWGYLRGLNLWGVGREVEAASLLERLGDRPDQAVVYATRALLFAKTRNADPIPDLRRALALEPDTRIYSVLLVQSLQAEERWVESLAAAAPARERFPEDFNLQLLEVRSLVQLGRAREAIQILAAIHVLPSEHARESHRMYERAHTMAAMDAFDGGHPAEARAHLMAALEWPESLGQGRPYEPEERVVHLLLGRAEERLGNEDAASDAFRAVLEASGAGGRLDLVAVAALDELGRTTDAMDLLAQDSWSGAAVGRFAARWARAIQDGSGVRPAAAQAAGAATAPFGDLDGRLLLRAITTDGGERR